MKVTKNSAPKVLAPEGTHIAILTQIIDWGTQTDSYGSRRKVEFIWETAEESHVFNEERGEEPFIIDRKFALTISRNSALNKALSGMTGKTIKDDEIDLEDYLGMACSLTIEHEEDGEYTNVIITSYAPLSKRDAEVEWEPHGELLMLDLDNFDQEVYDSLIEWKQTEIAKSPEYKEAAGTSAKSTKRKRNEEPEEEEEEEEEEVRRPVRKKAPVKKTTAKTTPARKKAPAKKTVAKKTSRYNKSEKRNTGNKTKAGKLFR